MNKFKITLKRWVCFLDIPMKSLVLIAISIFIFSLSTNLFAALTYPSWFDEAYMADIAYNLFHHNEMRLDIVSPYVSVKGDIYGPVFFYLQMAFIKLLGFQPITFRVLNLLAAYVVNAMVPLLLLWHTKNRKVALWVFILLLVDSAINRSTVTGRMDMVATLFALTSLICAYRYNASLLILCATAFCAAITYLTTPRALFLLPGTFIMLLFKIYRIYRISGISHKIILNYLLALLVFTVPIALWVWSVGGISYYIQLFVGNKVSLQHFGGSVFRDWDDYILLPLLLSLLVWSIKIAWNDRLIISVLFTFLFFSFCVREVGPYRAMIMPYLYLAGSIMLIYIFEKQHLQSWVVISCTALVLFVSLPRYCYRAADILYINADSRNIESFQSSMLSKIPDGHSFMANYDYYFLIKPRASSLLAAENLNKSYVDRGFAPDYILLNASTVDDAKRSNSFLNRLLIDKYQLVSQYNFPIHSLSFSKDLLNRRNYNGTKLYRKI